LPSFPLERPAISLKAKREAPVPLSYLPYPTWCSGRTPPFSEPLGRCFVSILIRCLTHHYWIHCAVFCRTTGPLAYWRRCTRLETYIGFPPPDGLPGRLASIGLPLFPLSPSCTHPFHDLSPPGLTLSPSPFLHASAMTFFLMFPPSRSSWIVLFAVEYRLPPGFFVPHCGTPYGHTPPLFVPPLALAPGVSPDSGIRFIRVRQGEYGFISCGVPPPFYGRLLLRSLS